MKQTIRLTESELKQMIKSTISEALNEIGDTPYGRYMMGRTAARAGKYQDKTQHDRGWDDYYNMKAKDCLNGLDTAQDWKRGYDDQADFQYAIDTNDAWQSADTKADLERAKERIARHADDKRYNSFQYVRDEKNKKDRMAVRNKYSLK